MWKGFVALIVLALLFSLAKSTIYPFFDSLFSGFLNLVIPLITTQKIFTVPIALIFVPIILFALIYLLGLLSDSLQLKKPLIRMISKRVPLVDIFRRVQENPESLIEVMFELAPGVFKKGILIEEKEYPFLNGIVICSIFEPCPISPGGIIYYVRKGRVIVTGRNATETIKEITFGYGYSS
ncbi:MAG: hypothetical protein AAB617_01405 [Patescibacteria group bacterium]